MELAAARSERSPAVEEERDVRAQRVRDLVGGAPVDREIPKGGERHERPRRVGASPPEPRPGGIAFSA
jgi:hypothetical protein